MLKMYKGRNFLGRTDKDIKFIRQARKYLDGPFLKLYDEFSGYNQIRREESLADKILGKNGPPIPFHKIDLSKRL